MNFASGGKPALASTTTALQGMIDRPSSFHPVQCEAISLGSRLDFRHPPRSGAPGNADPQIGPTPHAPCSPPLSLSAITHSKFTAKRCLSL